MKDTSTLSAKVLGQITLVQSMLAQLPGRESVLRFVCRGLQDVPGTESVGFRLWDGQCDETVANGEDQSPPGKFAIELKGYCHGLLDFTLSDADAFSPYVPFIQNLANMLAVMFEERRQRRHNKSLMEDLERRVIARTRDLEEEIEERRQAEDALRSSERNRAILLENLPQKIFFKDQDSVYLSCNDHFALDIGIPREKIIGKTDYDLYPREIADKYRAEDCRLMETGKLDEIEERSESGGHVKWVHTVKSPIRGDSGAVIGILGIYWDITERKNAEEERRANLLLIQNLGEIDRTIKQETDVEQMLWAVLKIVFRIFNCDRAWLLHPCDPDAPSFRVPVEINRPEYPGAEALNLEVPMAPGQAQDMRDALASEGPVTYTKGTARPMSPETARQFGVQAQMFEAIFPKVGKPWLFGLHQCSHPRIWTEEEQRLFREIGRRMADGVSNVLVLRELKENEKRFRATFEQAAVGVAHTDLTGRWLRVNRKLCDIVGYSREELLQKTFQEITHPDDLDADLENVRQLLAGENLTYSMEKRYVRKDGSNVWINLTVSVVYHDSGKPAYFLAVIEDITSRKRMDRALRSIVEATSPSKGIGFFEKLTSILATTLGCRYSIIGEIDAQNSGHINTLAIWMGQELGDNFTYDLKGTPCEKVMSGGSRTYKCDIQKLFPEHPLLQMKGADSYSGVPLYDSAGVPLGLMAVLDDKPLQDAVLVESVLSIFASRAATEIERLRVAQIREGLVRDLESKNAELERFAYTVSHDLKSPIITIMGYLGLLRQDIANDDTEATEQDLLWIAKAAARMHQLLDELLNLSRIGRQVNPSAHIQLRDIALEATELISGQIGNRHIELVIHDDLPEVFADRPRMLEVFQNLLDNSVKYSSKAENPRVTCGARMDDEEIVCFVEDNGIGIPLQYREKVFGLFEKLDSNTEGSGVGLALVKRIVEQHGGRIWIESGSSGEGTRFCFTLEGARTVKSGVPSDPSL